MTGRLELAVVVFAFAALAASPPVIAGSSNTLYLSQDGTSNTIHVDQSGATNSTIGGVVLPTTVTDDTTLTPLNLDGSHSTARQSGSNNSADITITDSGGEAGLLQDNLGAGIPVGNSASIALSASNAQGLVAQLGDNNTADLSVSGANAFGGILENGNDNNAKLSVINDGTAGSIVLNGSGNKAGFEVRGTPGASASYTLNGSNATFLQAASVTTNNGAQVTIVQTAP